MNHDELDGLVLRALAAGHTSIAEYCLILEAALQAIGAAPAEGPDGAGPWAAFARLALTGHVTEL